VVRDDDWAILRDFYDSGFFFSSRALQATDMVPIALEHIYRQSDADFIELLNRVRDSRLDEATLERLNSRHLPGFKPNEADGWITLTTHNRGADHINETRLRALGAKPRSFTARIEGDYPAHSYPTAETLTLKQGAQVMFVRNDSSADKRFFNGKIGTVTHLERERIVVRCPAMTPTRPPPKPRSRSSRSPGRTSSTASTTHQTDHRGGHRQLHPVPAAPRLGHHHSQEPGADLRAGHHRRRRGLLARTGLRRLEPLQDLRGHGVERPHPAPRDHDRSTRRALRRRGHTPSADPDQLDQARIAYQQRLLQECWDFDDLGARLRRLLAAVRDNHNVIDVRGADSIDALERQTMDEVVTVGQKFRRELASLYRPDQIPEDDGHLQERVRKASAYFSAKLGQGLLPWLDAFAFDTDNKALRKTLREQADTTPQGPDHQERRHQELPGRILHHRLSRCAGQGQHRRRAPPTAGTNKTRPVPQ
jgi:hypothetical protein